MKIVSLAAFILAVLLFFPNAGESERGLGPPFTHITLKFVTAGGNPQPGVNIILKDGANREHTGSGGDLGKIKFTIQAESATAFVTYWKNESSVYKKALPYQAGNNYTFRLEVPE